LSIGNPPVIIGLKVRIIPKAMKVYRSKTGMEIAIFRGVVLGTTYYTIQTAFG